jgi:hypothetical protein
VGWDGEGGDNGVGVVVSLEIVAEEIRALDIEQRAVQQLQLLGGMLGSGR